MASSWGSSWGRLWGAAWGKVSSGSPAVEGSSYVEFSIKDNAKMRKRDDEEVILLITAMWTEIINA